MAALVSRTILILLITGAWLSARTIAFTFTAAPFAFQSGFAATRGFEFTVDSPLLVTDLGVWDQNGDGLANAHEVGIWSSSSTLLASITIPSGTTAGLEGSDGFRFLALAAPLSLGVGVYRIGGFFLEFDADGLARAGAPTGVGGITSYVGPRFSGSAVFSDPSTVSANAQGIFGPNFIFEAAIPEPGTSGLLAFGIALLSTGAWRRSRRKNAGRQAR